MASLDNFAFLATTAADKAPTAFRGILPSLVRPGKVFSKHWQSVCYSMKTCILPLQNNHFHIKLIYAHVFNRNNLRD